MTAAGRRGAQRGAEVPRDSCTHVSCHYNTISWCCWTGIEPRRDFGNRHTKKIAFLSEMTPQRVTNIRCTWNAPRVETGGRDTPGRARGDLDLENVHVCEKDRKKEGRTSISSHLIVTFISNNEHAPGRFTTSICLKALTPPQPCFSSVPRQSLTGISDFSP